MNSKRKIIIIYSSIWKWHISAAQAIKDEILKIKPNSDVLLKDIRDFMNPIWRKIDEKLYWFIVKNLPKSFETLFKTMQDKWNKTNSISKLATDYSEEDVLNYIKKESPYTILSTHYWAVQVLSKFREEWLLLDINIWWLHTDYFVWYFPKISNRIDKTFLAHSKLEEEWAKYWVPSDKFLTTWMPVNVKNELSNKNINVFDFFNLDKNIPIILIISWKEWVWDFSKIIKNISIEYKKPIQIVAVCWKNKKLEKELNKLKNKLSNNIDLKILWLVDHHIVIWLMYKINLLITKAGWLTPSEAFTIWVPTILLDIISGHEKENALLFSKLWLAELVKNDEKLWLIVDKMINDDSYIKKILEKQWEFKKSIKISEIADFAINNLAPKYRLPDDFWKENWTMVTWVKEILWKLDKEVKSDIEILLSYSSSKTPQRIIWENPFWHIAIRIWDVVYSTNHNADNKLDNNFLQHLSLWEYLYWVKSNSKTMIHTSNYWHAYGRDVIWLRVFWIKKNKIKKMLLKMESIEKDFTSWKKWNKYNFNCANIVADILLEWWYDTFTVANKMWTPVMPLDIINNAYKIFKNEIKIKTNVIFYSQIIGAKSEYSFSKFPLSYWQPLQLFEDILNKKDKKDVMFPINKQVCSFWDWKLILEDIKLDKIKKISYINKEYLELFSSIFSDIKSKI